MVLYLTGIENCGMICGGDFMDVRVLRYFLAVAQEENISAAAEYLHLTQPTLSRQLMDLEQELGKKLFIRGSRKVTLTEDGLLLRKRAGEIVALVDKTEAEFHETEDDIAGDIYIGGGETSAMRLIAQTAKTLQIRHPQICYHLFSGNADDVMERLDKGLLDFGLLIEPVNLKKYDHIRLPATDTWGVLMRRDSPLAEKTLIQPEDMWELPLLISRQSMIEHGLSNWMKKGLDELHIAATYNLLFNAALMVEAGIGYAICLDKLANTMDTSELCFRPLAESLTAGMHIVWKKYQLFSKASQKFLECLQESFSEISL